MKENEVSEKVIGCAIEVHRLINFNVPNLVDGVRRVVNKLPEE